MKACCRIGAVWCLMMVVAPSFGAETLNVGDPAPALRIAEWIKGEPVDMEKGKGKTVYVVEFWATWCRPCLAGIPHLTELQKKHGDKLAIIAVSNEDARTLKHFVASMGDKMAYTVAADKRDATWRAYLEQAGVDGIPYAFVIDKEGRVAWHDYPDEAMDRVIERVIAGTYNLDARIKVQEYFRTLLKAAAAEDTEREELHARVDKIGKEILESAAKNPEILDVLAWHILTLDGLKKRDMDLAMKAAKAAYEGSKGEDALIIETYARALWDTGKKAEAVQMQQKAVDLAKEPAMAQALRKTLERYQREAGPTTQAAEAAK